MSIPMQDLHALGLNPFAVTLLAESMLKSAYVKHCGTKPLTFEFPVRRSDCDGWAGVRITIEAVSAAAAIPTPAALDAGNTGTDGGETRYRKHEWYTDEGGCNQSGGDVIRCRHCGCYRGNLVNCLPLPSGMPGRDGGQQG